MQDQILHKIYHYANAAHGNQMRKYSNERYMVHPQRVMKLVADYRPHTSLLAAALLHDVLEDTHVTAPELLEYLNGVMQPTNARDTLKLVLELTDVYEKESYPSWNRKKRKQMEADRLARISPAAQTIKYADIIDNTHEIMQHDPHFGRVFSLECQLKLHLMTNGEPALRKSALSTVQTNLAHKRQKHARV